MTTREMIDNLSGTLLCDERILSVPERELLANLLQRTRIQSSGMENAITQAITRTVGELIAERALGVLGDSMTRQLLQQPPVSTFGFPNQTVPTIRAGGTPPTPPPSPAPGSAPRPPNASQESIRAGGTPPTPPPSPAPGSAPRPPNASQESIRAGGTPPTPPPSPAPGSAPRPPNTSQPSIRAGGPPPSPPPSPAPGSAPRPPNTSPPGISANTPAPVPGSAPRPPGTTLPPISFPTTSTQPRTGGVAVLEADDYVSAECVILDEVLTLAELNALRQYVLEQEMRFETSEVLAPGVSAGAVDYEHRRSRVLMDLGGHEKVIVGSRSELPAAGPRKMGTGGVPDFPGRDPNHCQQPR